MRNPLLRNADPVVMTALVLYLIFLVPGQTFDGNSRLIGSAVLFVCACLALILWTHRSADHRGYREKLAWMSLLVTAVIAIYFFVSLWQLGWNLGLHSHNHAARNMMQQIVLLLIGWDIVARVLRRRERGAVLEDERDQMIEVRARALAHTALVVCVFAAILILGAGPAVWWAEATPAVIANGLIVALMLSQLVKYVAQVYFYRKGRT